MTPETVEGREMLSSPGRGDDGQSNIQMQHCSSWLGEQRGQMVGAFSGRAGYERDELAVEFCFAHEQSSRNRHAHPAVF